MRRNAWKDESVKQGERREEELTDGCGCLFHRPPFWLLKVSLEKKCSKERKNLQMFDAVLLTVISAKAAKREARDGLTVDSQGEKDF